MCGLNSLRTHPFNCACSLVDSFPFPGARMLNLKVTSAFVVVAAISSPAIADLRITEVMSSSNGGGSPTGDFFEVTNYGSSAVSLSGWKMDDNSFALANAVAMSGIASIGAGESVIFLESAGGAAIDSFRTFWGGLSGIQVGYYSGSGTGFGSGGDAVIIFDSFGTEATRVSFGAALSGSTFFWGYNSATGTVDPSYSGVVSTVGTIGTQVTVTSSGDTGSLGTAIGVPAPGVVALLGVAGLIVGKRRR